MAMMAQRSRLGLLAETNLRPHTFLRLKVCIGGLPPFLK